jgi:hypothetical protein
MFNMLWLGKKDFMADAFEFHTKDGIWLVACRVGKAFFKFILEVIARTHKN